MPWSGHSARHAMGEVYERIKRSGMTLVFVNTRSQAEFVFQTLWSLNEDALADRACITARSMPASAAASRKRWRRAN